MFDRGSDYFLRTVTARKVFRAIYYCFRDSWLFEELKGNVSNEMPDYDLFTSKLDLDDRTKAIFFSFILKEPASTYHSVNLKEDLGFDQTQQFLMR